MFDSSSLECYILNKSRLISAMFILASQPKHENFLPLDTSFLGYEIVFNNIYYSSNDSMIIWDNKSIEDGQISNIIYCLD